MYSRKAFDIVSFYCASLFVNEKNAGLFVKSTNVPDFEDFFVTVSIFGAIFFYEKSSRRKRKRSHFVDFFSRNGGRFFKNARAQLKLQNARSELIIFVSTTCLNI